MYDTEPTRTAYFTPSFLFFLDGFDLLLSKRYGPDLIHRLCGVWIGGAVPSIQWITLWNTGNCVGPAAAEQISVD